jgi:multisubunit Na+/H+ antiporter MnhE subunit
MNDASAQGTYLVFMILSIVVYTALADDFTTIGAALSVVAGMIIAKLFQSIIK